MSAWVGPCMGGFCQRREKCEHYVNPDTRRYPAERLCDRGHEETMFFLPLTPKQEEAVPA